ncbi:helix-turn-helix domain-containing protein [Orbus hercynius]|uniref:helix-turn-helix domain-containing protein n=1 Tax=Orbus hercynius TaxID=593135 RepID=UPI000EACF442|nr:helix-turn-helix domain-containing protein [Orbus hercynius]
MRLDDLADSWFISRSTIQSDIAEVKDYLNKYGLALDNKPYQGMRLIGDEPAIRACLTNILWQLYAAEDSLTILSKIVMV